MRSRRFPLPAAATLAAALSAVALGACGGDEVDLEPQAPLYRGAVLFEQRCSGCHTLSASGAEGSAYDVGDRERTDGPNFNVRAVDEEAVLYAIRNGGFSGAIMPENIVVGEEAQAVAEYVAKYSGRFERPVTPGEPSGAEGENPPGETPLQTPVTPQSELP